MWVASIMKPWHSFETQGWKSVTSFSASPFVTPCQLNINFFIAIQQHFSSSVSWLTKCGFSKHRCKYILYNRVKKNMTDNSYFVIYTCSSCCPSVLHMLLWVCVAYLWAAVVCQSIYSPEANQQGQTENWEGCLVPQSRHGALFTAANRRGAPQTVLLWGEKWEGVLERERENVWERDRGVWGEGEGGRNTWGATEECKKKDLKRVLERKKDRIIQSRPVLL